METRPLKVGLVLPQLERSMDGATPRWSDLRAFAERAEAVGFDSLWVVDHLLIRWASIAAQEAAPIAPELGVAPPQGVWEGWSLLAAVAAVTSRVELGTLVACTGYRTPAMLAKTADTLDEISGGRLVLGLGAGDFEDEHRSFGFRWDHRVSRFEEALKIIHPLLRAGRVDFEGTYHRAPNCELRLRPGRVVSSQVGPPLLFGVLKAGPRMLRLTAQFADQWNAWLAFDRCHPDAIPPLREAIDRACLTHGRDPTTLARTVTVRVALLGRTVLTGEPMRGEPEELAESLRAFAREGISHVQVILSPGNLAGIEAFAPTLELLDQG